MAFDAADLADLNGCVDAGDIGSGMGDHDVDPFARVRRAADDLLFALIGGNPANAQAVGIRVLFGGDHMAGREGGERGGGVFDALNLKPKVGQRLGNLVERRIRFQMIAQPVQGEFHRSVRRGLVAPGGNAPCKEREASETSTKLGKRLSGGRR